MAALPALRAVSRYAIEVTLPFRETEYARKQGLAPLQR
jgi:hypothetical protein